MADIRKHPVYVVVIFSERYGLDQVQGPFLTKEKADFYSETCDYEHTLVQRISDPDL